MPHGQQDETVIDLCRRLIETPSESGKEEAAIGLLYDYLGQNGVQDLYIDPFGSLIASAGGGRPGPVLLFDGHIDTVPVPDPGAWTRPPYGGLVDGNRIFGRGSSDMKGALAAMAAAATQFIKANGGDFKGTLVLAATVQEEIFEGVAARAVSEYCKPDVVVIGEATALNLNIGQRGRAEIKIETFGIPAHSSNPEKGRNAVYLMADAIGRLRNLPPPRHPLLGAGIMELTDIKSEPYPGARSSPPTVAPPMTAACFPVNSLTRCWRRSKPFSLNWGRQFKLLTHPGGKSAIRGRSWKPSGFSPAGFLMSKNGSSKKPFMT